MNIILHMELMEVHMVELTGEDKECMEDIITTDPMVVDHMQQDQTLILPRITADC